MGQPVPGKAKAYNDGIDEDIKEEYWDDIFVAWYKANSYIQFNFINIILLP